MKRASGVIKIEKAQRSVAEIFARDGEAFFRARESEVLARLMAGPVAVISTGGGAFVSQANRDMIARSAVSVWLKADLDLLWQRVRHKTTRPLLRTANPRETLRGLYEARMPFYQMADLTVDSACDLSVEDMARRVIEALGTRADVLEIGRLHAPGVARPLSDMSALRRGDLLLAAGGVDPATITLADVLHHTVREGLLPILLAFGLLGLIAMLASLPLLTRALKPLVSGAAATSPLHPDRRISESKVPLELLPLVRSFNAALDRVADELVRRKRFVADVAHELRTPLAILSLQADELPDDERKPEIQRVLSRMAQMVAQMLDVERLSHAGTPRVDVDLAALARDVAADMAPLALAAGYEVSVDAPAAPVLVQGDPHALARALSNLVGNAIAHAGGQGAIELRVTTDHGIEVTDSGPGVPEAILHQLFEPFSRARWDRDGCGMGLHLTREVMRAHGGDAELLPAQKGARFRLSFPAGQMRDYTRAQ